MWVTRVIRVTKVTWVIRLTWVTRVTRVTWVTRVTRVTTVTCVTRVTWVTCVTMMSGLLFSRMTRVFKYEEDKLKNTNDSNKEKEIINGRAIYTRENKPRLSLAAAFVRHKKNYLY